MAQEQHFLQVRPGPHPLPFFAEYPYFVWGEVDYESEGDCQHPTDRGWARLALSRRDLNEKLEIARVSPKGERPLYQIKGSESTSVWSAAYITALRSAGSIINPPSRIPISPDEIAPSIDGVQHRLLAANRVQDMFNEPALASFDSHAWWGGWKWCEEFASGTASGLRYTIKAVIDGMAAPEMIDWLQGWWNAPPGPDHIEGVRYALYVLTGSDPTTW
ncbi:MAG: hypothetical protein JXB07_19145 [Anaerolineae bacterium]|nr:hypothetical protein [Anaerolineae bacterium]